MEKVNPCVKFCILTDVAVHILKSNDGVEIAVQQNFKLRLCAPNFWG